MKVLYKYWELVSITVFYVSLLAIRLVILDVLYHQTHLLQNSLFYFGMGAMFASFIVDYGFLPIFKTEIKNLFEQRKI